MPTTIDPTRPVSDIARRIAAVGQFGASDYPFVVIDERRRRWGYITCEGAIAAQRTLEREGVASKVCETTCRG